jgi:hypothetical protein
MPDQQEVFLRARLASKSSKMATLRRLVQFSQACLFPFARAHGAKKRITGVKKLTTLKIAWLFSCLLVSWAGLLQNRFCKEIG